MKEYLFRVQYIRYLESSGVLRCPLPYSVSEKSLLEVYRGMQLTRAFDTKAVVLQRQGLLGTFPSSLGQEGVSVVSGYLLEKEDVYVPHYRDHGALFQRSVRLEEVLLFWGGDERGSKYALNACDFPLTIPIATQLVHAAGVAYALQYRGEKKVVLASCGDGGTSKGDFYDAVNAAGIWNLPLVIVIHNNQWAISMPRCQQTHAETLAQKSLCGGVGSVQVDGNDVFAVYGALQEALGKAREGGGPSVIEALTYRLSDHTTADDARRYVPPQELQNAWEQEPLRRFRQYLLNTKILTEEADRLMCDEIQAQVEQASQNYLNMTPQAPESMFEYLYESLPHTLRTQRDHFLDTQSTL